MPHVTVPPQPLDTVPHVLAPQAAVVDSGMQHAPAWQTLSVAQPPQSYVPPQPSLTLPQATPWHAVVIETGVQHAPALHS